MQHALAAAWLCDVAQASLDQKAAYLSHMHIEATWAALYNCMSTWQYPEDVSRHRGQDFAWWDYLGLVQG